MEPTCRSMNGRTSEKHMGSKLHRPARMIVRSRLLLPVAAIALAVAFGVPAAFADDMSKDSMSKDSGMKKDSMSKDQMSKDSMSKDSMSKEKMSK